MKRISLINPLTLALAVIPLQLHLYAEPANLVDDGNFVQGIAKWNLWNHDAGGKALLSHSQEGGADGTGCLLLETTGTAPHALAYYALPRDHSELTVRGLAKVEGSSVSKAVIGLQGLDRNYHPLRWETVAMIPNENKWIAFEARVKVPEGDPLHLVISLEGAGSFRIDQLSVTAE
ncbi:MAG: hypothetical protein SNJ84_09725 [Verrucomicrobiia bacterium]